MLEEESIEIIASKIHRLQKSHFIDQPLLPLLLLSDKNSFNQDNLPVGVNCTNNTCTTTTTTTNFITTSSNSSKGNAGSILGRNTSSSVYQHPVKDSSKLNAASLLKHNADTKERSSLQRLLTAYWCPKSITAQALLEETKNLQYFSTGIESLDKLLGGRGLKTGEITEVIGKSSTCKTQLCLSVCASVLHSCRTTSIVYLDTKGDFLPDRLKEYLVKRSQKSLSASTSRNQGNLSHRQADDIKQCLTRIRHCSVPTINHLIDALTTIRMYISKSQSDQHNPSSHIHKFFSNCKLVIIDSLAMPYLIYMATLPQLAVSQLALAITEIQRLATLNHCTVLVTNHARSSFSSAFKDQHNTTSSTASSSSSLPTSIGCLGINWSLIPHHRILFECTAQSLAQMMPMKIKATLIKTVYKNQFNHCTIQNCNPEIICEFNV
ncbi:unnamed protein product [Trichobilharzia szidati]|nr:unnamed protein product [Trichobilharzia szidati]